MTIYFGGDKIAEFKNVNGILVRKDRTLEVLNDYEWITFTKEEYDWFDVL